MILDTGDRILRIGTVLQTDRTQPFHALSKGEMGRGSKADQAVGTLRRLTSVSGRLLDAQPDVLFRRARSGPRTPPHYPQDVGRAQRRGCPARHARWIRTDKPFRLGNTAASISLSVLASA